MILAKIYFYIIFCFICFFVRFCFVCLYRASFFFPFNSKQLYEAVLVNRSVEKQLLLVNEKNEMVIIPFFILFFLFFLFIISSFFPTPAFLLLSLSTPLFPTQHQRLPSCPTILGSTPVPARLYALALAALPPFPRRHAASAPPQWHIPSPTARRLACVTNPPRTSAQPLPRRMLTSPALAVLAGTNHGGQSPSWPQWTP